MRFVPCEAAASMKISRLLWIRSPESYLLRLPKKVLGSIGGSGKMGNLMDKRNLGQNLGTPIVGWSLLKMG